MDTPQKTNSYAHQTLFTFKFRGFTSPHLWTFWGLQVTIMSIITGSKWVLEVTVLVASPTAPNHGTCQDATEIKSKLIHVLPLPCIPDSACWTYNSNMSNVKFGLMVHIFVLLGPSIVPSAEKKFNKCIKRGGKKNLVFQRHIQKAKFPSRTWEMANILGKY